MRDTNIYSVRDAIQHITRTIQLNKDSNAQQLPYFFIAGAGISAPNIPSANGIIKKCKEQVKSMCSSDEYQHHVDTIGMESVADQYSSWMALAFPNKIDRSNFFRQQIKNAGITSANLLLAQILCSKKVATTVLTPNFDDILKQSMDLLGQRNVLVAENAMDNLSITPYNQEELQIVHVHGTYRFYDCANLNSEILEVTNKNGTLSSTQLLRNFLQAQAPIIIGYSGWESDVIMTCLAERLSYPVPRSYIWVCYTQEDYAKLPGWLKSNKDVIFVLPDSYFSDEKCDTNVETKRKDPSFGDEYVKQQYCQTVDAASFFYKLISNLGIAEPAVFTNPSDYYKNLSENILPKDQYSWHLKYWAEKMHRLTAQNQPVEQAIRHLEAALVERDFDKIVNQIKQLTESEYANTSEDADFICSTLFPKILNSDFLVNTDDHCHSLCSEMLDFQDKHSHLVKDRSILQHKIMRLASRKSFSLDLLNKIHAISQKHSQATVDELVAWGDVINNLPPEKQLAEFDSLLSVCKSSENAGGSNSSEIHAITYLATMDRILVLPINDAIAEYQRVRQELISEKDAYILRIYGINVAARIAQKTSDATCALASDILCDLERIVESYSTLYEATSDDFFWANKCYSCIYNLLLCDEAGLVQVNNLLGRVEHLLDHIRPNDKIKDCELRNLLSAVACYYPVDIISDQQKIEFLQKLNNQNAEDPDQSTIDLFDYAILGAYTYSQDPSAYYMHFSAEELSGAAHSRAIEKYCEGSLAEAETALVALLDNPIDEIRKLAAGNLAYMIRRNEAPTVTQSFERLVEMADSDNSTLQVNILLYFAINKNGEASDLCRQTWHAFCQLSPAEREDAANWWQNTDVVGVEEHKIVTSLLRYADADMDLLTMLKKIREESSATSLVAPLS